MNSIRAVLFDFDGTLTLPGSIDFAGIKRAIHCPADMPILEYIESLPSKLARQQAWRTLGHYEDEAAARSKPNEGAEAMVRWLKRQRIRRGILTRNRLSSVTMALKNFAHVRSDDFNVIIARDHVRRPKPDPEGVLLAARRLRVPVAAMMMVGDYRYDVEAGQRAGARTVFLESPLSTRRPDPPAGWTIHELCELQGIIEKFNPY